MALVRETTTKLLGYKVGDLKQAHYSISYTAGQVVMPANDPDFIFLNGCVVSQTTYPILFSLFGTKYNTGGEGVGNFRLPDFTEGKVPIAKGLGTFTTVGASGGEINHTLTLTELPSHGHSDTLSWSVNSHGHGGGAGTSTDGGHTHTISNAQGTGSRAGSGAGTVNAYTANSQGAATDQQGGHSHGTTLGGMSSSTAGWSFSGSVSAAGGGGSHNNMQPYLVIGGWLVKFG